MFLHDFDCWVVIIFVFYMSRLNLFVERLKLYLEANHIMCYMFMF